MGPAESRVELIGHNAMAGDQPCRRAQADHAVDICGAPYRARRIGAHCTRGKTGCRDDARPGTRPRGRAGQVIRIARGSAHGRTTKAPGRAQARPLRQVGFAQNDGTRGTQPAHQIGVPGRHVVDEGIRSGRRCHTSRVDIVLEHDRHAIQRTQGVPGLAALVRRGGLLQRIGRNAYDSVQWAVIGFDARDIGPGHRNRTYLARSQIARYLHERFFLYVIGSMLFLRPGDRHARRHQNREHQIPNGRGP